MKFKFLLITVLATISLATACGSNQKSEAKSKEVVTITAEEAEEPTYVQTEVGTEDEEVVCNGNSNNADHIVISKESMTLKLYDANNRVIHCFPIAVGKNYGDKQRKGDMKTPEGEFTIQQITNASSWSHDFKDGKGEIPHAYGDWFIRLLTPPHSGIGIHGTHDPKSIGTRATEGCIRLNNKDLNTLRPLVKVGMKVTIETSRLDMEADGRTPSVPTEATTEEVDTNSNQPQTTTPEPANNEQKPAVETKSTVSGDVIEHTIESGEVLGNIAIKYNTSVQSILDINPGLEPTKIRPGQKILVKKGAPKPETPKAEVVTDPKAVYHTVEKGEFGGTIANKYNTSWSKIMELNPGLNERNLQIGKKIRVK